VFSTEQNSLQVMGYADTDVAEFVYTNKPSVDQLIKFVCKDITKACAAAPPPVPKVSNIYLFCVLLSRLLSMNI
jgi:hypothetical protein